jgi:hypothetical protein
MPARYDDAPDWAQAIAQELVREYGDLDPASFGERVAEFIRLHPELPSHRALVDAAAGLYSRSMCQSDSS